MGIQPDAKRVAEVADALDQVVGEVHGFRRGWLE
jgi:hypothetical protein